MRFCTGAIKPCVFQPKYHYLLITNAWVQRKLEEVAPLQSAFDLPKDEMKDGKYPVVMSNGINGHHSECKAKAPGVVTGRSGTIGNLHYIESDYWPHNTTLWVTDFMGNYPKYIYHLYSNIDLSRFGTGTGVPTLNRNDVHNEKVSVPCVEEQIKISGFLTTLDDTIALHKRKLDGLRELKKGYLQQMFPQAGEYMPRVRFDEFMGEWRAQKLGEVAEITMGQSPNSSNYTDNPSDHILVQGNADVKNGKVVPRVYTTQVTKTAKKGDLILSVRAPVGDVGKTSYDVVLGRGVAGLRGNEFVYQTLVKMRALGYWSGIIQGSTFESINSSDLKESVLSVPSIAEQTAIGNFFSNLDQQITAQAVKLKQLRQLNMGYLQKMFI